MWVTAGTAIGIAPYAAFLERLWLIPVLTILGAGIASVAARSLESRATHPPGPFESLLAGVGSLANMAVAGFVGIAFYLVIDGASRGVLWILDRVESGLRFDAPTVAAWVSAVFAIAMVSTQAALAVQDLARQLYPNAAGLRSNFYALVTFERRKAYRMLALPVVVVGGAAVALFVPGGPHWAVSLGALFLLVMATIPLENYGKAQQAPRRRGGVVDAVRALFEAGGYTVVTAPRTAREDIDPLLARTPQLYAEGHGRSFAIDVLRSDDPVTDDECWENLSELSSAAWVLGRFVNEGNADTESVRPVVPVVVVAGSTVPLPVKVYENTQQLRLVQIAKPEDLDVFLGEGGEGARKELAERYLSSLAPKRTPLTA